MSSGPATVLQLFRSLDVRVGGPRAYYLALRKSMESSDVRVDLATLEPLRDPSLGASVFEGTSATVLGRAAALDRWLRANLHRYAVVHLHGVFGWHALLAPRHCRRSGVPFVLSTHGHLMPSALRQKAVKKGVYLRVGGRARILVAHAVLATTELEREAVKAAVPGARVKVVTPGVSAVAARAPVEVQAGPGRPLELLYLGRLHPHKRIEDLLSALACARRNGATLRLTVAGAGTAEYTERLRKSAGQEGVGGQVTFAGYVDGPEKAQLFHAADVLVMPSASENFSFAVAEALAHGVPVILTAQVGLAALVQDFQCGSVVDAGDVGALSAAIERMTDQAFRRRCGTRARACAAEALSYQAMREALVEVYAEAS